MTAAALALCACGAAVPAVLESDTPPETSVSPSAEASGTPTPEPTDAPTPTPPATPEPTEEPTPSPEPVPDSPLPSWEELQRTLYETNAYCAALYLGRSSAASLSARCRSFWPKRGWTAFPILPISPLRLAWSSPATRCSSSSPAGDKVLSLYNYVLETQNNYDAYPGALLYSSAERCAVAVRCNESDVRPNVLAVFSGLDGEQSFSPRITLENETLLSAPGVFTLTPR